MSTRSAAQAKSIVEGMAFALWTHALREYERGGGDAPWDESPPPQATQPAMELVNLYELANGASLVALYQAIPFGYFTDAYDYGEALANKALGTDDDGWVEQRRRAIREIVQVRFEISFTGDRLVWSGEIEPITSNPAKHHEVLREQWQSSPPTTIVIELADHGYMAWLESANGNRLPISFGAEHPPSNAREALAAAKRFLNRVYGRSNPARVGGPTRSGEPSRFRETFRGHGRTTAVKPLPPPQAVERELRRQGQWQPLTIDRCPGCGQPAHASESDDDGYHAGCRPSARKRKR